MPNTPPPSLTASPSTPKAPASPDNQSSNDPHLNRQLATPSPRPSFSASASSSMSAKQSVSPQTTLLAAGTASKYKNTKPGDTSGTDSCSTSADGSNPQQFCLRWNNYQKNLTNVFDELLQNESFVDVTLACDGNSIKAHKMVLSACSPYFQSLFFDNPCQHPIIIMRDVKWPELKAIVEFMYKGEINVSQEQIGPLLRVADMLRIRGLADVNGESDLTATEQLKDAATSKESKPVVNASSLLPDISPVKKQRLNPRNEWDLGNLDLLSSPFSASSTRNQRKRRWPSASSPGSPLRIPTPDTAENPSPAPTSSAVSRPTATSTTPIPPFPIPPALDAMALSSLTMGHADDLEIKPGIAEMIREEERVSSICGFFNVPKYRSWHSQFVLWNDRPINIVRVYDNLA